MLYLKTLLRWYVGGTCVALPDGGITTMATKIAPVTSVVSTTAQAVGVVSYNGALLVGGSGAAYKWGNNNTTWPLLLLHFGFITNAAGNLGYSGNPTGPKTAQHIYGWLHGGSNAAQRNLPHYASLTLAEGAPWGLQGQTVLALPEAHPIAWLAAWVAAPVNANSNLAKAYNACMVAAKAKAASATPKAASATPKRTPKVRCTVHTSTFINSKGVCPACKAQGVAEPQTLAQRAAATNAAIAALPSLGVQEA